MKRISLYFRQNDDNLGKSSLGARRTRGYQKPVAQRPIKNGVSLISPIQSVFLPGWLEVSAWVLILSPRRLSTPVLGAGWPLPISRAWVFISPVWILRGLSGVLDKKFPVGHPGWNGRGRHCLLLVRLSILLVRLATASCRAAFGTCLSVDCTSSMSLALVRSSSMVVGGLAPMNGFTVGCSPCSAVWMVSSSDNWASSASLPTVTR